MYPPTGDNPPKTVGTQPRNADEVNAQVGTHLEGFIANKNAISQDHNFFLTVDLKVSPYWFSEEQETLIKSAIADLDTALDAVNMTFISQLVGMG